MSKLSSNFQIVSWFYSSYIVTPFHLLERYGKYGKIQNGTVRFINQLVGLVKRACTSAWTVSDVYEKVWVTWVSDAALLQTSNIFLAFISITAAVHAISNFCVVKVLKVLYLNTQKPLSASHLHKSQPNEILFCTTNMQNCKQIIMPTYKCMYYKKRTSLNTISGWIFVRSGWIFWDHLLEPYLNN